MHRFWKKSYLYNSYRQWVFFHLIRFTQSIAEYFSLCSIRLPVWVLNVGTLNSEQIEKKIWNHLSMKLMLLPILTPCQCQCRLFDVFIHYYTYELEIIAVLSYPPTDCGTMKLLGECRFISICTLSKEWILTHFACMPLVVCSLSTARKNKFTFYQHDIY